MYQPPMVNLTPEQVLELQAIMREEYGKEIGLELAEELGVFLIECYAALLG